MSWFQSLRDDFSLRPFEIEHTRDRAAMASGPPDVTANQEPAEVQEECSGKKKSKFQTFKKFFARKKRKEPSAAGADAGLKASQSSDNLSKTSENNTLTRSEKDKGSGSKISLGSKALSHDSVFVSDSSEANEALGASQDSIHGKVKSIQLQLKQAIKLGSPPSLICMKGRQDAGTMSEDDGLPCSPPEYTTLHTVMNQAQGNSSISLEGVDHDDDQLSCATSSRAVSPLVVPGDFSQPASPYGCLDNSAAKHKMGLRHKACNKRKPASRLELKAETDSVDEVLNNSITEALAAHEQQKAEGVSFDELKLKVEREEDNEEEEDEEMEREKPQSSSQSLLRDQEEGEEEREEGEEESEAGQDVSHGPDTSPPPPQPSLSEEDVSDAQPLPCSTPSSTASPVDSPRATPEPPAGPREYVLDPAGLAYGAEENRDESALALIGEKDRVQEDEDEEEEEEEEEGEKEEESSFLQEVLSSLKTPLASCSLGVETEDVVLKTEEEVKEKEVEEFDIEEGEEMTEEEPEVNEVVTYQAATLGSLLLAHTTEEEEDTATVSCQEEVVPEEDLKEEETEEEVAVEQISQHGQAEKEADELKPEDENDAVTTQTDIQVEEEAEEEEEYQSEGEEEAIELEKEPDVEEEGWEKTEEADEEVEKKEGKERVEEAEEAVEDEDDAEEMTERFPDAADDEEQIAVPLQEADEGAAVVEHDTTKLTDGDEVPTEVDDEGFTAVHECHANYKQDPGDEREGEEERVENAVEIESTKEKAEPEKDVEAKQQVADETEKDLEQDSPSEVSPLDLKEVENDQREAAEQVIVSSKPSSLSIPKSTFETQSQESECISPSKTSTTTIHINLVSPSSEKVTSFFQQSPTAALPEESKSASHAAEQATVCAEEEEAVDTEEETKEEKQSDLEEEATPTDSVEATINQPCSSSDQGKVRFTITPAWQRKQSLTSPSSPPACLSSSPSTTAGPGAEEAEAAPAANTEPASSAKVELVLSPGRVRSAGSITAKPQNSAAPPPCSGKPEAAAGAKGSSVIVEGNPDNPFGVRLRKTSALQRFSSEEENTESPTEAPIQPTSCKVESPQPISVKPPISQPGSNKPALPKKPDVHGDVGKTKRISEPAPGHVVSGASDSPSWISVAKQKQKIYKENSLDEITVKKEEPERKNSLPTYVTSAANREQSNKTAEPASKVSLLETSKPSASVDKEARRPLSPPTPVPLQPSKSPSLPCPVPPKPHVLPSTAKPPPQPNSALRSLSPPTPVPVSQKSPSCTSPPSVTKAAPSLPLSKTTQPQSTTVTSPPFSSRTTLESTGSRAPGISGQVPSSQRGLPAPALPQDEPPWMALAKKKAKAWSEMPQIVQ
ncbi:DUF4592 domain-containing protein isoform X2 [Anabas testudineus]|uniref:DUF4592 domain-containing protein isoform X2 n=1 Tax=Anabas testudineus TaxID=64144 RepID=UPI000E461FD5|nr:DUF4592 domain-containing protein isoform X2 [Anabas testudineus]